MEDLETLVGSSEFAVVKAAVEALDPMLLIDTKIGAHLMALRVGLQRVSEIDFTPPAEAAPEPEVEPAEPVGDDGPEGGE